MAKPKSGKEAAANDDTGKEDAIDRNVTGAELYLDGACFDTSRLVGDLGDFLLNDLRTSHELKSWAKMSEREQDALIDRADKQANAIIAGVVRSIASHGLDHMEGLLDDKGSFGDGFFKLSIKVPMNAHNLLLLAKHDGEVQVVFSSPQKFQSSMMVRSLPDEPRLPGVDDDDAEAAAEAQDETAAPTPGAAPSA